MATQKPSKRLVIRWATLKGLAAIILFLIIAILVEYSIVIYAMNLGVEEKPENRIFGIISPLFHLVPIAVIITLAFSWAYLTRHIAVKPHEMHKGKVETAFKRKKKPRLEEVRRFFGKIKSGILRVKGIAYLWQKIHFARATIKSALIVLLVFSALILAVSILAYPQLIYQTASNIYRNNPSLLNFVKATAQTLSPIFSVISNALLSAAPRFRDFVLSLSSVVSPLVRLDNVGKYLAFQNVAAWISAITALVYGQYMRKSYRYRKTRKT